MDVVRADMREVPVAAAPAGEPDARTRAAAIIEAARDLVQRVETVEADDRTEAEIDLDFKAGDQWPEWLIAERNRPGSEQPCLTFNEILPVVKQVTNDYLQNRPQMEVYGVGDGADQRTAQVQEDMLRHILYHSQGQGADEVAVESQVSIGKGYIHLRTQYVSDDSFQQEIVVDAVRDPALVYFDPNSTAWDGADATECVLLDRMRREDFTRTYPDAEASNARLIGGDYGDWLTEDSVAVACYYRLEYEPDVLYSLQSGQTVWQSQLDDPRMAALVGQIGFRPDRVREVQRKRLKYYLLTAVDILEEQTLPGDGVPIIPFYGEVIVNKGKVRTQGMIRALRDPQQMVNYAETTKTVLVGLQPRAPWVGPEGFMGPVGSPQWQAWQQSNASNVVGLEYARTGLDGLPIAEPPQRQPFPAVPVALVEMRQAGIEYIQRLSGVMQPAQVAPSSNRSMKSLREQDAQSTMTNFHYVEHAKLSLVRVAQLCLAWIPTYYTEEQVVKIVREDGTAGTAVLNQRQPGRSPQGQAIQAVLHDVTVGKYATRATTGPGYHTKRAEAGDKLVLLAQAGWQKILDVAGSDLIRSLDMPGGDRIAQKLAVSEPMLPDANVDAEQALPQVLGQLQQMQQQAQALNALAQQLEQQAKDLEEQNRTLRLSVVTLQAQREGEQAEASVQRRQDALKLQEEKWGSAQTELRLNAQIAQLQSRLAQSQLATKVAQNGTEDSET